MYPMGDPYSGGAQPDMTEYKASEGEQLADGATVATEEQLVEAMRTVYDPEIPVNIWREYRLRSEVRLVASVRW